MRKAKGSIIMLMVMLSIFESEELVKMGYTNVKEFGGIIDWPYGTVK